MADTSKLLVALIHWLSEFPDSAITSNCSPHQFLQPKTLYKVFRSLLFKEDFNIHSSTDLEKLFETDTSTSQGNKFLNQEKLSLQVEVLEQILDNHFAKRLKSENPEHRKLAQRVDFHKLIIFQDNREVIRFSEQLVKIGTYTSKASTFGLTSLEFLTDEDRILLKEVQRTTATQNANTFEASGIKLPDNAKISGNASLYTKSENFFIGEDELEALKWENAVLEKALFDIVNQIHATHNP